MLTLHRMTTCRQNKSFVLHPESPVQEPRCLQTVEDHLSHPELEMSQQMRKDNWCQQQNQMLKLAVKNFEVDINKNAPRSNYKFSENKYKLETSAKK